MFKCLSRIFGVTLLAIMSASPVQASIYVSSVLADNPLVYYRFQEESAPHTGIAFDSSGNNLNGQYLDAFGGPGSITSIAGATSGLTPGKQFNVSAGTGALVAVPAIGGSSLSAFSIEFLLRPVSDTFGTAGFRALYTTNGGFSAGEVHLNLFPETNNIQLAISGNDANFPQADLGSVATVGSWTHVVVTYEADGDSNMNTIKYYANGNLLNPGGTPTTGSQGADFSKASTIGSWNGDSRFFSGGLDEFAIYGSALSDEQVAARFAAIAIPEPTSFAFLGVAAVALVGRRRRI